jgi:hypothetical protein
MTDIDGALLDAVEAELRGRTKEDAIHSAALADAVGIDDGEGNPKTREVIRILMEERGLPIGAANCGYWLIESRAQLETYTDTLEGRIQGIQDRIDTVTRNYEQAIADGGQVHVNETDIRHAIREHVDRADAAMRADVVDAVSDELGCSSTTVQETLDELVENGFAYLLESGEVRLP